MMYCERCNIDFLEGLRYCKWCGQTLIERSRHTGDLPSCPNCATPVQPNWTYCKGCGARLATAPISPATASCPQCGSMTSADARHCPTCGYHLSPTENISAGSETPGTAIIAYCPTCNELIDPGSVYCKGCGSALYEQQTPFGESAIICSTCQSFNPVGSAACRVCGASLTVTSGVAPASSADQSDTQIMSEYSSTLPDLADRRAYQSPTEPVGGSSHAPTEPVGGASYSPTEPVTASSLPTEMITDTSSHTELVGSPRQDTAERVSRPPVPNFNSGANTMVFDSQGTGAFNGTLPIGETPPPTEPTPPKGNETGLLPGVAGSKFEQPAPTHALPRGRDTGPVEGEEGSDAGDNVSPPNQASSPLSQVTRLDAESLSSRLGPPSHDTFTFSSKAELTPPEGTLGLRADNRAPTGFENDANSSPTPFVFSDEVAPPNRPNTPPAPQNPPTVPMASVIDTDGVAADETKVLANAPSATPPLTTPPPGPPSPVPPSSTAPPSAKLPSTQALSNAVPRTGSLTNAISPPPTEIVEDAARRFDVPPHIDHGAQSPSSQQEAAYYAANPAARPVSPVVTPAQPSVKPPQGVTPEKPVTPKKSSAGLIIGLAVGLVIAAAIGFAAWWFLVKNKPAPPVAIVNATETPTDPGKTTEPPPKTAPAVPEGMVMVPAGTYAIGRDDESALEQPKHDIALPAYFIDRTEVTNEAYKKFVDETNHKSPTNWQGKDYPTGRAQYPVTGVTWQDAVDYATWAGKRLPSEAEWEGAARGPQGLHYPWGNEFLQGQANIGVQVNKAGSDTEYPPQIMAVGGFPQGASPAGALDMIGNVWEYTADEFKLYPGNSQTLADVASKLKLRIDQGVTYRVIRGGAFDGNDKNDASYRGFVNATQAYPKTGFRCVKDAK